MNTFLIAALAATAALAALSSPSSNHIVTTLAPTIASAGAPATVRPNVTADAITGLPMLRGPNVYADAVHGNAIYTWTVNDNQHIVAMYGPFLPMGQFASLFNATKAWEAKIVLVRAHYGGADHWQWVTEFQASNFLVVLPKAISECDVYAYRTWNDALAAFTDGTATGFERHARHVERIRGISIR